MVFFFTRLICRSLFEITSVGKFQLGCDRDGINVKVERLPLLGQSRITLCQRGQNLSICFTFLLQDLELLI